ncbi:MAG: HEAT repeat domain-containing protein [Spirochaetales bacterium]|nr:HEAT repeat domain-containing protein [Spirochaetales bacterium]
MVQILESVSLATLWLFIAIAATAVIVLVVALLELRFRRIVRKIARQPSEPHPRLGPLSLALRERYIVRKSERGFLGAPGPFPELLPALGYPLRWLEAVRSSGSRVAAARLLEFAPELGLFDVFFAALRHAGIKKVLLSWLGAQGETFALRRIALSGPGRAFDGASARLLLSERLDEVREMLGDPEWSVRAMAVRILSGDESERSMKGVSDSLGDPHPLVRRLALESPLAGEREALYQTVYGLFTKDTSLEVRRAAKARIIAEFPDLYEPDTESLGPEETIHVLELLDTSSQRDEEIAFHFLETGAPEQALAAAEHLQLRGSLKPLLEEAKPGDSKDFERRVSLLSTAASYQVFGFLRSVETVDSDGAFEAAARVLEHAGDRQLITVLARRWFERMGPAPYPAGTVDVYKAVLAAISARGDEDACGVLATELLARRNDPELEKLALRATTDAAKQCVFPTLAELFGDPAFKLRDELREALARQEPELVVPFALSFLRADRAGTPRVLRRDAVILAGALKLSWAVQRTLETLPAMDAEEIAALAPVIVGIDAKVFKSKARYILDGVDAPSRAAILAALPATGDRSFMADVKSSLRDADPDVRAAAVRALASFQEDKALTTGGLDLLRDPVERVRVEAASALAEASGSAVTGRLAEVLADANEVDEVKASLIRGLGKATTPTSLDLLIDELGTREDWVDELGEALSQRRSRSDLTRIFERFKDATGELKPRIAASISAMGKPGEDALVALLEEDIVSLKPFIVEALESLGYVEARIRELKHRDPITRRQAAAALALVGSRAAYRGIVLAARDPDIDVRVSVTRALERLAGPEGEAMLTELTADPDARVRKYTLWAMERVKAKAL